MTDDARADEPDDRQAGGALADMALDRVGMPAWAAGRAARARLRVLLRRPAAARRRSSASGTTTTTRSLPASRRAATSRPSRAAATQLPELCTTLKTYLSTREVLLHRLADHARCSASPSPISWPSTCRSLRCRWCSFLICTIPFWTSNVIRMISWIPLLGRNGLVNQALIGARARSTSRWNGCSIPTSR